MRSHVSMALGLVAGLTLGLMTAATGNTALADVLDRVVRPLGRLFLNLLTMVVVPLVATALFTAVAGLGDLRRLGRLGGVALGFFWSTTIVAIGIGFLVASLALPFAPVAADRQAQLRAAAAADTMFRQAAPAPARSRFISELVPANPVRAAVDGNLLALIVFVTIFGAATATLPEAKRRALTELADAGTQALIRIVWWVLWLAPAGIFALVAPVVARLGWSMVGAMVVFLGAVIAGCLLLIGLVYLPAAALAARLGPGRFLRAALPSLAMGFSTTSSLAALPVMLDAAERDLRMSRSVAGLVLPLGASLNRAGSALYQAVAVLFAARLYGVPLGAAEVVQAGATVFLASLTVAAVPAGSVVSLAPAFVQTGLPLAGLGILLGLDRIPDMFRTMTNVAGHLTGAALVATAQGERLA